MSRGVFSIKGIHYRSELFYNLQAAAKLGSQYRLRFRIAARYVKPGESVVDLCSGPGSFRHFLPQDCTYTAVDASPEFLKILRKRKVRHLRHDLHQGWPAAVSRSDVAVMIISLCQFRDTSAGLLLEEAKRAAQRVVIVEDVLERPRGKETWFQRAVNYLCAADYYVPIELYTREAFIMLMRSRGYRCVDGSGRYVVGIYEK